MDALQSSPVSDYSPPVGGGDEGGAVDDAPEVDESADLSTEATEPVDPVDTSSIEGASETEGGAGELTGALADNFASPAEPTRSQSETRSDDARSNETRTEETKKSEDAKKPEDPSKPEDSANVPTLDLSKPLSVKGVQALIDAVANEGGESGGIKLHAEGAAKVYGALKAGGWADLGLNISKADNESSVTLGLNTEIAAKLGFDLGIFNLEVAAGGVGNVKARFQSSADAAAWFTENLHNINEQAGSDGQQGIFQIGDSQFNYKQPTIIEEGGAFVQGSAGVKVPDRFQGEISLRGEGLSQQFTTPDGQQQQGSRTSVKGNADLQLALGKLNIKGGYQFEQHTQTGDPVTGNNGTYRNHQVHLEMDYEALKKMTPDQLKTMVTEMQKINDNDISLLAGPQVQKVIDAIKGQMGEIEKNPPSNGKFGTIGLTYEANNILEGDRYNNQFQRLFLTTESGYRGQANLGVVQGEYSLSAHKSERLWNRPGVNTESHAQQIFDGSLGANGDRQAWDRFKQDNPEVVQEIARLHARNHPGEEVDRMLKQGNIGGAIQELEGRWNKDYHSNREVDRSARSLANYGNEWVLSNGEEAKMLQEIERVFRDNPGNIVKLFDRMESMGMTRDKLMSKTGGYFSTHDEQLQGYYNIYRQLKSFQARKAS